MVDEDVQGDPMSSRGVTPLYPGNLGVMTLAHEEAEILPRDAGKPNSGTEERTVLQSHDGRGREIGNSVRSQSTRPPMPARTLGQEYTDSSPGVPEGEELLPEPLPAKLFDAVRGLLRIRHVVTTAYHPQTKGQTERFNRTLATQLQHYVSAHQRDWDSYVQPLTYACNMQVREATDTTPFELILTRHPPGISVHWTVWR